ncbi:MAG: MopE-related protein, partial [Flavobacteriales bacterium]
MTWINLKAATGLSLLCVTFALTTTAQVNINPTPDNRTWQEMMQDPNTSFYQTQSKFNEYWSNRPVTRGSGFKAFKRWEWFMEPRVNERGIWPMPDAVQRAINDQPEMFNTGATSAWSYIGNTSVPSGGGGAGRINSVRELPGSTTTFFACAPAGGLWKTTNSGTSWSVVGTDFLASIGVSDVAIDPSATNTMYIATGDGDAGDTYSIGVMKTMDGGTTWTSTGLTWSETQTRTMSRILIHPTNNQIVLCATSNGVYRTTDGGTTWTQTVTGNFKDLAMKPGDPNTWYACTNQLYRSIDGGVTWSVVTSGLPASASSQRMALAVSANNSAVVYILASGTDSGLLGVYKSSDSGVSFTQMTGTNPNYLNWDTSATANTGGQGWYDLRIAADPSNANTIFIGGVNVWKSTNGGSAYTLVGHWYGGGGAPYVHADIHALYFVPNTTRLLVGCDGGVFTTTNGGTAFSDISTNLAIAQIYRLSVANTNSNLVISGWQDNGTNLKNGTTHTRPLGGDGMDCQIDPSNASVMYGELYYGSISKSTNGGSTWTNIVGSGGAAEDENGAWVTPYVLGPNPNHIYVGKSLVFKSLDGGTTFTGSAAFGGTTDCNYIAVAPSNTNIVFASKGSSLFKSTDNAATFVQLNGLQGSYIGGFAIHNTDPNKIWVCFSNYTDGGKVYYSSNGGSTWTNISGNLPNLPANAIAFQPGANNGVYVGMDAGVFYRDDVLGSWVPYMNALPRTPISDLDVHINTSTITASTYGRGLWRAPLYTLPGLDAAVNNIIAPRGSYCTTSVTPQIEILNAGTTTVTSMVIGYTVNGIAQPSFNWTGSLVTGATVTLSLPTLNNGAGAFTFQAIISSVNGITDEIAGNNTQSSTYYCINGTNNATLTLETDCYASEISWNITDANGNVVHSGAGYNNETTIQIPLCFSNGCYTFNIFDSYGDGLSGSGCSQGAGNYFMTDNATGALHFTMTNASYGTGTSHSFCYPVAPISGCTQVGACNYNAAATVDNGTCTFGPSNDLCAGATTLIVNAAATSSTNVGTCQEATNPSCGGTTGIKDVWFKFVYQGGPVTITTNFTGGTLNDTRLAVYSACGGSQLACNDDISSTNYKSTITFACGALTVGNTYYIQAGGYNATTGTFSIRVTAPVETCNNLDDDCDGVIDEGFDLDLDGFTSCGGDCNDNNPNVRPNATETCNGIDDNCNGTIDEGLLVTFYQDADGDGYGNAAVTTQACSAPTGYVSNNTDCNDSNANVRPNATESCTTSVDDNCNGQINENCCTVSASATTTSSSCVASANGSVNLTVSGGVAPFTFAWSNGATTEDLAAVAPGTYSVTVTDANGCTATASAVVGNLGQTVPAAPTAISGPNGVCRNSTGNVFTATPVAGATSYLWTLPTGATGSSTTNTITLSFSSTYNTGNLCVRAVTACGTSTSYCQSVAAYTTAPTTPGSISGPTVNVCAGTTQTYSIAAVSNATSYTWTAPTGATIASGQGTTSVTVSFSSTFGNNGVLSVQSVNCFGSSTNRTLTIYKIPGTPAPISGLSTSVCPGSTQTYTIAAVVGATSYVWTAPANAT